MDLSALREDFPLFAQRPELVYLDSAATSQKPRRVIEALRRYYETLNANVHRGAYRLSAEATEAYEEARRRLARFLNAEPKEIVFVRNTTEAMNLVAYAWGLRNLKEGDEVLVTEMEHHANLIPWQQLAARTGATLKWFTVTDDGRLDLSQLNSMIDEKTKVVALTHQSNVLGTINPLEAITKRAHEVGAVVVLDACQSVPHMKTDVKALDIDFLAFSGHKAVGPTGIGVFWGRAELLADLPPFLTGGSMIENVTMESATWAPAPKKFEAGVPNMAQAVGLGAALTYLTKIGMDNIHQHEIALTKYLLEGLSAITDLRIIGPKTTELRGGVVSFTLGDIHPHDLGQYLDSQGIAVRTGHHCAWPLTRKLGVPATTRASVYLYNTTDDLDALIVGVQGAQKYFGR